jgi:hypothetical protein
VSRPPAAVHSLFVERSTPSTRAYADNSSEDLRQVTLICEAAGQATSRDDNRLLRSFCFAASTRSVKSHLCGAVPMDRRKARERLGRGRAQHTGDGHPSRGYRIYVLAKRDGVRLQLAYIGSLIRPSSTAMRALGAFVRIDCIQRPNFATSVAARACAKLRLRIRSG